MQSPKARNCSNSEVPVRVSPRGLSSEISPKVSPRPPVSSSNVPLKLSPRVVRQLKIATQDSDSSCSSRLSRAHKDGSLKLGERKLPRSPVSEAKKKGSNKVVAELEAQISQLQNDLKKVNDQLDSSESQRKKALQDAEESNNQLLALSSKLEETKQQAIVDDDNVSRVDSELENLKKGQQSVDSALLDSAVSEIKELKLQLEFVAESELAQTKHAEIAQNELNSLKESLADTLVLVEKMDNELENSKESESRAKELVGETLFQLQTAKKTVETLRSDGFKTVEAYEAIASELEQSKAQVNSLDALIHKLKSATEIADSDESHPLNEEIASLKSEVNQLRSALEASEIKFDLEKTLSEIQLMSASEKMEKIKSSSSATESDLQSEIQQARLQIEELKSDLIDKETELQSIREENEGLNLKLEEIQKSKFNVDDLKTKLLDKETELQNILEENETLKMEINKIESTNNGELEAAKSAEREALMKLGYVTEEVEKNHRRIARVTEQLEAAQAANSEMETELRRLKVQSDQWRKAAEAAAAMISSGKTEKFVDRAVSMDSKFSPRSRGIIASPYSEDGDDDTIRKKSPNVLKKFLWKKTQK